jgi:hypothetical protein
VLALTTGLALLPWSLYRAAHAPPPPADQTHAYSYSAGMWHVDQGDPSSAYIGPRDLVRRLDVQSRRIAAALGSGLQDGAWSLRRARRDRPSFACCDGLSAPRTGEVFALGILALHSVYFGFRARLVLPVFAIALPAAIEVLRDASLALWRSRAAAWLAPACVALLIALEFEPRRGWDGIEARHRQNADRAAALAAQLPEDARPAPRSHDLRALERPVPGRGAGRPDGAEALIEKYRLDTSPARRAARGPTDSVLPRALREPVRGLGADLPRAVAASGAQRQGARAQRGAPRGAPNQSTHHPEPRPTARTA